ncbi:MAG: nuclear transport factor 2 family protein [Arenimonas sp.]
MPEHPIETWHRLVREQDLEALELLLDEEVVFVSPIVHTPQRGKALATMYLGAALKVFFGPGFCYLREIRGEFDAMLEFETLIDGVSVNGVDIIKWDGAGRIVEFKVMLRPLKALGVVQQRMGEVLQAGTKGSG